MWEFHVTWKSYEFIIPVPLSLGKHREDFPIPFWDLVVLTTSDENQKVAFELQIKQKLKQREIPLGVPYHVFSDPPGPKAGMLPLQICTYM